MRYLLAAVLLCAGCGPSYDELTQRLVNEKALLRDARLELASEQARQKQVNDAFNEAGRASLKPTEEVFARNARTVEAWGVGLKAEVIEQATQELHARLDEIEVEWGQLQAEHKQITAAIKTRIAVLSESVRATEQALPIGYRQPPLEAASL